MQYVVSHEEVRMFCISWNQFLSAYPNETYQAVRRRRTVILALRNRLLSASVSFFRHPPREYWHVL